jgi:electron transfer flavoprotein beta subunit
VRIAICVKEVPDPTAEKRIDPATKRLVRNGETTLNPYDRHAIEAAVQIKEGGTDAEITVVCVAPESANRTVDRALAQGGDRSVHIADDAVAGSDLLGTARVLAGALGREDFDLILLGQQAADSECYVMAALVAELLGRPCITQAASIELADGHVVVKRQVETGYDTVKAPLPCVVSVSDAINEPRYPPLPAIMGAKKKPHERFTLAEIGIDAGSVGAAGAATAVADLSTPPGRGDTVVIEDDGSAADKIIEFLVDKKVVS